MHTLFLAITGGIDSRHAKPGKEKGKTPRSGFLPTRRGAMPSILGATLPETNSSHLKMDGWNTTFLLGWPIFRCELLVSGRVICFPRLETMFFFQ